MQPWVSWRHQLLTPEKRQKKMVRSGKKVVIFAGTVMESCIARLNFKGQAVQALI